MIRVTGPLWLWQGGQGSWHFLTVPEEQSDPIRAQALAHRGGFGSVKAEARANGVVWRTSLFPQRSGGYLLPVKASVRSQAGIVAGDQVSFEVELL